MVAVVVHPTHPGERKTERGGKGARRGLKGGKRGQIKHCSISAKQPAFYKNRKKQDRMGREIRGKNLPLGVAEDIVEIIRVRHTLEVHSQRFISNLSLTVKFITEQAYVCSNAVDTFR